MTGDVEIVRPERSSSYAQGRLRFLRGPRLALRAMVASGAALVPAAWVPAVHEAADVVAKYRAETRALVAARYPIAVALFLVLMAFAYSIEWLYFPDRAWPLTKCYLAFAGIGLISAVAIRRHPRRSIEIALGSSILLSFAMVAYLALIQKSAELTLLAMIGFLTGLVVQFPWGAGGQVAAAAGAIGAYLWALEAGAVTTLPVPYGLFALVSHSLMTVIGARLLDVYRFTAFREATESQRANAAKSEFLATVSHELRTPLNIIVGYTDLMLEGTFPDPAEQRDALTRIHHQSRQLLDLIQSMLDLNRMEAGGVALEMEEFPVTSVLDAVRASLPASWCKPDVTLVWEANGATAAMRSDRRKVETVLRNLIHNACKYTEHGSVTIRAEVDRGSAWVAFEVCDTGQGIAPGDLAGIFEMFRQGSSGPPRGGGVGLGLYIARQLTDALGGRIEVASALGAGARFTVAIPLHSPGGSVAPGIPAKGTSENG